MNPSFKLGYDLALDLNSSVKSITKGLKAALSGGTQVEIDVFFDGVTAALAETGRIDTFTDQYLDDPERLGREVSEGYEAGKAASVRGDLH